MQCNSHLLSTIPYSYKFTLTPEICNYSIFIIAHIARNFSGIRVVFRNLQTFMFWDVKGLKVNIKGLTCGLTCYGYWWGLAQQFVLVLLAWQQYPATLVPQDAMRAWGHRQWSASPGVWSILRWKGWPGISEADLLCDSLQPNTVELGSVLSHRPPLPIQYNYLWGRKMCLSCKRNLIRHQNSPN